MDASKNLKRFGDTSTGDAVFDASQYAFFGKDVLEEVELGGLDDEEEDIPAVGLEDEEEFLFDRDEVNILVLLSSLSCFNYYCKFMQCRTKAMISCLKRKSFPLEIMLKYNPFGVILCFFFPSIFPEQRDATTFN
ncbi:hypothetical protein E1A91_A01G036500v1 [Gossypium mustelinum]|uniref:Uncharacterized protein n=1 Tax=Gossypium mustelinum TaxID=34275 RepID=A0A5D3AB03_GOSMU|nr:hypothetical protein E1A91_A01G036500v1 [Gossypium mustelinum]